MAHVRPLGTAWSAGGSVWDIVIWAIPFGIIGGRLYHVVSSPDAYFGPGFDGTGDLWLIPQIQRGGLGIWGAVVLGVVGAWIGCRKSGVKLTAFLDAAAPGLLLAQAVGRWGNYFNQELFGGPTTLPWGLQVDADNANFPAGLPADTLFHPTFLYESLWNIAGVLILLALDRRFHFRRGRLFWAYAMYYTLGRVWIEAMRIDDAEQINLFGITARLNVWTSILVFVVALVVFILLGMKGKPDPDSVYLDGREPAVEGPKTAPNRSVIRTLLSQIVNRVIISLITKAVPGALPPQRMRSRKLRLAGRPSRNRRQPKAPAAKPRGPRRRLAVPSSQALSRVAEPPLAAPKHHSVVASGQPRTSIELLAGQARVGGLRNC